MDLIFRGFYEFETSIPVFTSSDYKILHYSSHGCCQTWCCSGFAVIEIPNRVCLSAKCDHAHAHIIWADLKTHYDVDQKVLDYRPVSGANRTASVDNERYIQLVWTCCVKAWGWCISYMNFIYGSYKNSLINK